MEQRFEALETRLAFQEDTIGKLDDALVSQQQQILDLQLQLKFLSSQIESLDNHDSAAPEPPPPHY